MIALPTYLSADETLDDTLSDLTFQANRIIKPVGPVEKPALQEALPTQETVALIQPILDRHL